ncbi:hypothetical protein [Lysobacter sp. CA199]|uniref:hypothetical protein n=1 Tax=Lysobacter sp. CA199 TaxID=3455608 RepID=UPI003F8D0BA7
MAKPALTQAVTKALTGFGHGAATLDDILGVLDYVDAQRRDVSKCLTDLWDSGAVVSGLDDGKVTYRLARSTHAADTAPVALQASGATEAATTPTVAPAVARDPKAITLAGEVRLILAGGERLTAAAVRDRLSVKASATRVSSALLAMYRSGDADREADGNGRWVWWKPSPPAVIKLNRPQPHVVLSAETIAAVAAVLAPVTSPSQCDPPPDPLGLRARFDAVLDDVEALVVDSFDARVSPQFLKHLTAAAFDLNRALRRLTPEGFAL